MLILKPKHILILVLLLFPSSVVYSAWSEPTQAPTGGNAAVPIYSEGAGQTLNGTLHVDPAAVNATSLQASGSVNGIQGNSVGNALFGNLTNNAAGGGRAVYGLAVDAADYGLYTSGGLGLGVASGDIWFLQQDQGIAWPRESDGASLYGVYVTNTGELQVRGHGAGINFMDQNAASRLTVSEAGVVNVAAGGSLKVNNVSVCLQDGTNCPAIVTPTLQQVTTAGNTSSNQILLTPGANVEALRIITSNWSPLVVRNAPNNADLFRVDQNGNAAVAGNITVAGQNVCRQDGTNCPVPPAPPAGANLWLPNGNDIYPNFSGMVKLNHDLQFNGDTAANAVIDFDPYEGNLGNYFLLKSGYNPTYSEKWHLRVNRTGETLLGGNLFIGTGRDVASMTPYNDPTVNASWKIGRVGGVNTIEATPGGGGASVGNINLKNGTLSAGYVSLQNDIFLQDGKSIQVPGAGQTKIQIGNYNDGQGFVYGNGGGAKTASLAVEGDIKGNQLCFGNNDCKSSWVDIVQGGGGAYWTLSGSSLYPNQAAYNVGIGNSAPGAYKLNVSGDSYVSGKQDIGGNLSLRGTTLDSFSASNLYINGQGNVQIRIDTNGGGNDYFKVVNDQNNTVFSVSESGDIIATGGINRFNGAGSLAPIAVKTDAARGGIRVECSAGGCTNNLNLEVNDSSYAVIKVGAQNSLVLQPSPGGGLSGGKVGIGTANPASILQLNPVNGVEGLRIVSSNFSPLAVVNAGNTDIFRVNQAGVVTIPGAGALGIGAVPTVKLEVSDPGATYAALINGNLGVSKNIVTTQDVTANKVTGANFCIGSNCKTIDWGPPSSAYPAARGNPVDDADTKFVLVPNPPPPTGPFTNYLCDVGWVMIGIRNESPSSRIICGKMW